MNDGEIVSSQNIKYEGMASTPETPVKEGYRFIRWNTRQDGTGRDFDATEPVTVDTVYHAIYEAVPAYTYTAKYYQKNEDSYKLVKSEEKTTYQGSVINATEEEKQMFDGYGFNAEKSDKDVVINGNGQIVSYYYDKMEYPYTVAYYYDGVLDANENEYGNAYLNDVITTFKNKNRTGYKLQGHPSLTIGKGENILRVDYVREEHKVNFYDHEGNLISTETVKYGDDVQAPEAPVVEGMHFVDWDQDLTNIITDMDVHAEYEVNTYQVEFQDMNGNTVSTQTVRHGKDANLPKAPEVDGYTFTGWKGNYKNITKNEIVTAQYRENEEVVLPPVVTPDDTTPPVETPNDTTPPAETPTETPEVVAPQPELPISPVVTIPAVPAVTLPALVNPQPAPQNNETGNQNVANENQTENEQPEKETENVKENGTPKAKGTSTKKWALVNLIAAGLTLVLAIFMLLTKREKEDEEEETVSKRRNWTRVTGVIVAAASIIVFLLTEDILTTMTMTDSYTIIMLTICLLQAVVLLVDRKYRKPEEQSETK